ncbi:MAG: bacillithiol biosynthesis deacetylase BshB1 [Bacteroidota bacterium]
MQVDVLAIGTHPDDIELACGGTVAKLVKDGYKVAIADLTQGELGTRGTKEIRAKEATAAAKILGVTSRINLHIPDGAVDLTKENIHKVIALFRNLRPKILLIPHSVERHPDHVHCHHLCKEAWFSSGLEKIKTTRDGKEQKAFRPDMFYEYVQWYHFIPSFIVDISSTFETKMKSIRAHASQLHNPRSKESETRLTSPEFLEHIEVDGRFYGRKIGVRYGEPFFCYAPIGVNDLLSVLVHKK